MLSDEYGRYLARFEAQVGRIEVGAYGQWQGRLVRKLSTEEFLAKLGDFTALRKTYTQMVEHGNTIDNALLKILRERAAELLLEVES